MSWPSATSNSCLPIRVLFEEQFDRKISFFFPFDKKIYKRQLSKIFPKNEFISDTFIAAAHCKSRRRVKKSNKIKSKLSKILQNEITNFYYQILIYKYAYKIAVWRNKKNHASCINYKTLPDTCYGTFIFTYSQK